MVSALAASCAEPPAVTTDEHADVNEVAAHTLFEGAAVFECESGETIQARFNYDPASATLRRANGETVELPLQERAESETYGDSVIGLAVGPGEAVFTTDGQATACQGVSRSIGPPSIEGVTRALRQADDGATVELEIGDTFSVSLVGLPTAGYQWTLGSLPAFLAAADESGGATSTAQYLPGFAGGDHWEVLSFRAAIVVR